MALGLVTLCMQKLLCGVVFKKILGAGMVDAGGEGVKTSEI